MQMRWKHGVMMVGVGTLLAALGGASPALADDNCRDFYAHRGLHRELALVHRDIHRDLQREHALWHRRHDDDWNDERYRREHLRLHRHLANDHRNAHRDLRRAHRRAHRYLDDW
jgi:hypothetical protein